MKENEENKLYFQLGEMTTAIKDLARHVKIQNGRIDKLEVVEKKHDRRWSQVIAIGGVVALVWGIIGPMIVWKLQVFLS